MQHPNLKRGRPRKQHKKIGDFNRLDPGCLHYIHQRRKQLGMSKVKFIQNCIGLAGPQMKREFKHVFNNRNSYVRKSERI